MPVRSHRRRAWLIRLGGYAIVAIALNALIVVACAWLSPKIGTKERGLSEGELRLLQENNEQPRDFEVSNTWAIGWCRTTIFLRDSEHWADVRASVEQGKRATYISPRLENWRMGFPFYCQRGYFFSHSSTWIKEQSSTSKNVDSDGSGGLLTIRSPSIHRRKSAQYIPLIPIWWGWLLNVMIYAAALAFICPAMSRRWGRQARRQRKGLCPLCAYDLKADLTTGCPECGWQREESSS